jgi:hypothetical protein
VHVASPSVSSVLLASKRSEVGCPTARLKSGAAKSWGKTDPGRAEIFALPHARPD